MLRTYSLRRQQPHWPQLACVQVAHLCLISVSRFLRIAPMYYERVVKFGAAHSMPLSHKQSDVLRLWSTPTDLLSPAITFDANKDDAMQIRSLDDRFAFYSQKGHRSASNSPNAGEVDEVEVAAWTCHRNAHWRNRVSVDAAVGAVAMMVVSVRVWCCSLWWRSRVALVLMRFAGRAGILRFACCPSWLCMARFTRFSDIVRQRDATHSICGSRLWRCT